VLPIGGLKEKLLAAHRAGVFEAILPAANRKDLAELPDLLKNSMKLHFVEEMDEVLRIALEEKLVALAEDTPVALAKVIPPVMPTVQPVAHQ
jgi:ATP-dependent Lon protease